MLKRGIATGVWLIFFTSLATGRPAWAKPADLPSNHQHECECGDDEKPRKFSIELGINSKGIIFNIDVGKVEPEPTPVIDAFLPAFVEHWLQHAGDALMRPERTWTMEHLLRLAQAVGSTPATQMTGATGPAPLTEKELQARQLFEMAEVYRRTGRHEAARQCYQRVHLAAPTSRWGRSAVERIQEMEERLRDAAEEQGIPSRDHPEASNRDIRNGSILLGLVEFIY